jgi:hypothetical protein
MSPPSWEAKGAYVSTSTATPSFPVPAGAVSNKIAIVSFFLDLLATTVTAIPSGFSVVPGTPVDASNHHLIKYWKRLSGVDSGTYDFVLSGSAFVEGAAELFNTCITTGSPFDTSPGAAIDNTAGNASPPVVTSSLGPDRLILHSATCWAGGVWTPQQIGYTKRLQPPVGLITSSDKVQAVQGSTGSITSTSTNSDKRTAHLIALIGTTVVNNSSQSISDRARSNMLTNRGLSDPQTLSNVDLMSLVLADGAQTLIPKTDATTGEHYDRYLITVRGS